MTKPTELYRIDNAQIVRFTDLAVLVNIDGEDHWFPFSQIYDPDSLEIRGSRGLTIEIAVPVWLAKKKGIL